MRNGKRAVAATRGTTWFVALAVLISGAAASAQAPVISFERAQELAKTTYPFTRFSTLASFNVPFMDFYSSEPRVQSQPALEIPPEVKALDGKTIAVSGYMLPIDVKPDGVSRFILTPTIDSCHWGAIGLANEWVMVEMAAAKRVPYARFQPVVMFGKLKLEPQWRGPALTALYKLTADYMLVDAP